MNKKFLNADTKSIEVENVIFTNTKKETKTMITITTNTAALESTVEALATLKASKAFKALMNSYEASAHETFEALNYKGTYDMDLLTFVQAPAGLFKSNSTNEQYSLWLEVEAFTAKFWSDEPFSNSLNEIGDTVNHTDDVVNNSTNLADALDNTLDFYSDYMTEEEVAECKALKEAVKATLPQAY